MLYFIAHFFRKKDNKTLTITDDKYDGGSVENPPLIIKNITRDDMGLYRCTCKNDIGTSESENSIFVNVICEFQGITLLGILDSKLNFFRSPGSRSNYVPSWSNFSKPVYERYLRM